MPRAKHAQLCGADVRSRACLALCLGMGIRAMALYHDALQEKVIAGFFIKPARLPITIAIPPRPRDQTNDLIAKYWVFHGIESYARDTRG